MKFNEHDVLFSYLPLAHVFERVNVVYIIAYGAHVRFGSGNTADFLKDVKTIKPTYLPIVPRLLNMIYAVLKPMKHASK
jgi:long-chain acyl-CoA synthetase